MQATIHITGVQYACPGTDVAALMSAMHRDRPEVLLVVEQTHDFGIIVRALEGTEYRGVVSRFDLERVLGMMQQDGAQVLVGRVSSVDREGLCYDVCVSGDYAETDSSVPPVPDLWDEWRWTGAPLLKDSYDDSRLGISLKVTLSELQRGERMNKRTLLEHLELVLRLARWDVSHETQQQLSLLRRLVQGHTDTDVRAMSPRLRHCLSSMGSTARTREFGETYLPQLYHSEAAGQMYQQWCAMHRGELSNVHEWKPAIVRQIQAIDECLRLLPAELYFQTRQFGALMHRLLYLHVPRRKLLMLLSTIVLRLKLQRQIGQEDDEAEQTVTEDDRYTIERLAPIFYGNCDDAREFLRLIRGEKPASITRLVNVWVRDGRIRASHCHRPLWTILHEVGAYGPTETNWNMRVTA